MTDAYGGSDHDPLEGAVNTVFGITHQSHK